MNLANLFIEVAGLSAFTFAATAWFKDKLGISGVWLTVSAFVFSVAFGMCYRYALAPFTDFASWFWAVAFGLAAGFTATGAYKGAQSIAGTDEAGVAATLKAENKQTAKVVEAVQDNAETPPQ